MRSMGAEQKVHCCMDVLMVSLQLGQGNTWTAKEGLKPSAMLSFTSWISGGRLAWGSSFARMSASQNRDMGHPIFAERGRCGPPVPRYPCRQ